MNTTDPPNQSLPALARTIVSKGNRGNVNFVLRWINKIYASFLFAHENRFVTEKKKVFTAICLDRHGKS